MAVAGIDVGSQLTKVGGIGENVGVVTRIGEKFGGMEITIPAEPQIAGAAGAALIAFDRAKKETTYD